LEANGRYRGDTPKGIATLRGVCEDIRAAIDGKQRFTLNAKGAKIGRLIAEGELGPHAAQAVLAAALAMPNYNTNNHWILAELTERVCVAIKYGVSQVERSPKQ
jgi:hypothetical protein